MKAVVFHGVGDIRVDDVPEPEIQHSEDAIVRLTASAICGTDLHFVRGTMAGMKPGTILGHEGVGVVETLGPQVRNFEPGERVVICSTIGCGACAYCRSGYYAQCDRANPNGPQAGTSFFGGPEQTGPFDGLQAEKARIPYAHTTLVRLPEEVTDEQAILISDIFPTGYFGAAGVTCATSVFSPSATSSTIFRGQTFFLMVLPTTVSLRQVTRSALAGVAGGTALAAAGAALWNSAASNRATMETPQKDSFPEP